MRETYSTMTIYRSGKKQVATGIFLLQARFDECLACILYYIFYSGIKILCNYCKKTGANKYFYEIRKKIKKIKKFMIFLKKSMIFDFFNKNQIVPNPAINNDYM